MYVTKYALVVHPNSTRKCRALSRSSSSEINQMHRVENPSHNTTSGLSDLCHCTCATTVSHKSALVAIEKLLSKDGCFDKKKQQSSGTVGETSRESAIQTPTHLPRSWAKRSCLRECSVDHITVQCPIKIPENIICTSTLAPPIVLKKIFHAFERGSPKVQTCIQKNNTVVARLPTTQTYFTSVS